MKPYFSLPLLGEFHTNTVMMILSLFVVLFLAMKHWRSFMAPWKIGVTVLCTAWLSFVGARLFHVFFERPEYFREHPEMIFAQFDGMTFYGAFLFGGGVLGLFTYLWKLTPTERGAVWDTSAYALGWTYFFMRLGCFANGCCWGTITGHPWAVSYYDPRSVMPYFGIPVHPVQIYDAGLGLFIVGVLTVFRRERFVLGLHAVYASLLYGSGRFVTEFFRGDSYRGEDLLFGLSTSQLISVVVFLASGLYLLARKKLAKD